MPNSRRPRVSRKCHADPVVHPGRWREAAGTPRVGRSGWAGGVACEPTFCVAATTLRGLQSNVSWCYFFRLWSRYPYRLRVWRDALSADARRDRSEDDVTVVAWTDRDSCQAARALRSRIETRDSSPSRGSSPPSVASKRCRASSTVPGQVPTRVPTKPTPARSRLAQRSPSTRATCSRLSHESSVDNGHPSLREKSRCRWLDDTIRRTYGQCE